MTIIPLLYALDMKHMDANLPDWNPNISRECGDVG
jgi:hypothetical protein